jgi:hypothetical protein
VNGRGTIAAGEDIGNSVVSVRRFLTDVAAYGDFGSAAAERF